MASENILKSERVQAIVYPIVSTITVLAFWQWAVIFFEVPDFFLPTPTRIIGALTDGWHLYISHLGITIFTTIVAFSIGFLVAVFVATMISESKFVRLAIFPLLVALQSMPKIALAPLIILWLGFGLSSKVALGALTAFFPILHNTVYGLSMIDSDQQALMRVLNASRTQVFFKVKLPNALPYLFAGVNIALIMSMLAVIVSEFLGASQGMGFLIVTQSTQFNTAGVLAGVFLLSLVGMTIHFFVQMLKKRLLFWAAGNEASGAK